MKYQIEINHKIVENDVLDIDNISLFYQMNYQQYHVYHISFRKLNKAVNYLQERSNNLGNRLIDYTIYNKNNMFHVVIVQDNKNY